MCKNNLPPQPIPQPLRGEESGTFAHHSVAVRLPDIARRTLEENDFPLESITAIKELIEEIPDSPIRPLRDGDAPDTAGWKRYLAPYAKMNWLQIPWFFAEAYFYRRILEASAYFQPGPWNGKDPFSYQKWAGLKDSLPAIEALSSRLNAALKQKPRAWDAEALQSLLYADLWGNQADYSLWPAGEEDKPTHIDHSLARQHLLVDDAQAVVNYLFETNGQGRIDFLIDNAGFELAADLCLADYFLTSGLAEAVRFHLKPHPTFVSDATRRDVRQAAEYLLLSPSAGIQEFAGRLEGHLKAGRLQLMEDYFWTSPLPSWEAPALLRGELAQSRLVICKGDAHYRRLLGDRRWPYTTPFADILCYYPAPILALRTLKSEMAAGLRSDQIDDLNRKDPDWLIDGRWGIIQFKENL